MVYDHEAIGLRLKEIRQKQNRKLEDIVDEIKIFEEYLVAIESGDLSGLPSPVYYALFVRTYSKELGLDPDKFLDEFISEEKMSEPEEPTEDDRQRVRSIRSLNKRPPGETSPLVIFLWVAGVIIIAIAAIMYFSEPEDETDSGERPRNDSKQSIQQLSQIDSKSANDSLPGASESDDPEKLTRPEKIKLDIEVTELSWILVIADDDTVLHRNLDSGATRSLTANKYFDLSIGHPRGVVLYLNERPVKQLSNRGYPVLNRDIRHDNLNEFFLENEDSLVARN